MPIFASSRTWRSVTPFRCPGLLRAVPGNHPVRVITGSAVAAGTASAPSARAHLRAAHRRVYSLWSSHGALAGISHPALQRRAGIRSGWFCHGICRRSCRANRPRICLSFWARTLHARIAVFLEVFLCRSLLLTRLHNSRHGCSTNTRTVRAYSTWNMFNRNGHIPPTRSMGALCIAASIRPRRHARP